MFETDQDLMDALPRIAWDRVPKSYRCICVARTAISNHIAEITDVHVEATYNFHRTMLATRYKGRIPPTWKYQNEVYDIVTIEDALAPLCWRDPVSFVDPVYPSTDSVLAEMPIIQPDKAAQERTLREIQTLWFAYLTDSKAWPTDQGQLQAHLEDLRAGRRPFPTILGNIKVAETRTSSTNAGANQLKVAWQLAADLMFWKPDATPPDNHPNANGPNNDDDDDDDNNQYSATLTGSGSIAQGRGATATGKGGVAVGGNVNGGIITTGNNTTVQEGSYNIRVGKVSGSGIAIGPGARVDLRRSQGTVFGNDGPLTQNFGNMPSSGSGGDSGWIETPNTITVTAEYGDDIYAPGKLVTISGCTVGGDVTAAMVICDTATVGGDVSATDVTLTNSTVAGDVKYVRIYNNVNNSSSVAGDVRRVRSI